MASASAVPKAVIPLNRSERSLELLRRPARLGVRMVCGGHTISIDAPLTAQPALILAIGHKLNHTTIGVPTKS